jgi:hypothetical protein
MDKSFVSSYEAKGKSFDRTRKIDDETLSLHLGLSRRRSEKRRISISVSVFVTLFNHFLSQLSAHLLKSYESQCKWSAESGTAWKLFATDRNRIFTAWRDFDAAVIDFMMQLISCGEFQSWGDFESLSEHGKLFMGFWLVLTRFGELEGDDMDWIAVSELSSSSFWWNQGETTVVR